VVVKKQEKKRKQEKKNIPKIVATFVYASSQGQRTHSARTNSVSAMTTGAAKVEHVSGAPGY
jgi:hypothetical protein